MESVARMDEKHFDKTIQLSEHIADEYFRRAMIYWEAYQRTGLEKYFNGYMFWRTCCTDGKRYANDTLDYLFYELHSS